MGRLISTFQFILGFIVGIAIIAGCSAAGGYFYISKMATNPKKPIFTEEIEPLPDIEVKDGDSKTNDESSTATEVITEIPPDEIPPDEIPPDEIPPPAEELLPANAYKARVTWPQGLSLRAEPDVNSARIGGIGFDAEIIIIKESSNKRWQKVRLPWSQQEGWVKGGNTKRVY